MVELKIKPLYPDSKALAYAHSGDAGLDVFSHEDYVLQPGERHVFGLGFAAQFPDGYVALVWDRGSTAIKQGLRNMAGVIDSSCRAEWCVVLLNVGDKPVTVAKGDKVAQVLVQPIERVQIQVVDDLDESERGDKWCGSTGS